MKGVNILLGKDNPFGPSAVSKDFYDKANKVEPKSFGGKVVSKSFMDKMNKKKGFFWDK